MNTDRSWDPRHRDNIFRYGHVGTFETQRTSFYGFGQDEKTGINAFRKLLDLDTAVVFTPSEYNPVLANYTSTYYDLVASGQINNSINNLTNIQQGGGLAERPRVRPVSTAYFGNVGAIQTNYSYSQAEQFRITASTNFDIGGHSLIAGLEYEQRFDRAFGVAGSSLWLLMRNLQNDHMKELDTENPILVYRDGVFQDTINYNRALDLNKPRTFDRNLRIALGLDPDGADQVLAGCGQHSPG